MSDRLYLGIDSGTQGVKVLAASEATGRILAKAQAPHRLVEGPGGRREQDPAWWIKALDTAMAELLATPEVDPSLVAALGVSGQQHGLVPLDPDGQVIRPAKLWCDTETEPQCRELTEALGGPDKVLALIGNAMAPGFTAPKLLWLKQNEPDNYDRLALALLPHDYINLCLTGRAAAECGDASGTAYFDVRKRAWSSEILSAIDPSGRLESRLPELIGSREPVGALRAEVAERWGLPKNVLVSSGGGDNMMAAIGTGNVRPGVVTTSLGTSGTIFACADSPVCDPKGEVAAFCSSTGAWLPLVCTMNVTVSTELARRVLGLGLDELNSLAAKAEPGAGGVLLVPYFNGERTPPRPLATATLAGLTSVNYTRENLCRAAMEGPTLGLKYGLDAMAGLGVAPTEIRLVGGGAKSPLWREIVANVFNLPVACPSEPEAGALGAAIQAAWCYHAHKGAAMDIAEAAERFVALDDSARVEPDPATAQTYAQTHQRYLKLDEQ